jgi:hypothetical protein
MLDLSNLGLKRLVHNSIEPAGSLGLKLIKKKLISNQDIIKSEMEPQVHRKYTRENT